MRIVGGERRGARLRAPKGCAVRPTADKVRQALFQVLGAERVEGARVLDLFCGTGALGLEALSRGAARAAFADADPASLALARANAEALRYLDRAAFCRADLLRGLPERLVAAGPFDLAFLDPPYDVVRDPRLRSALRALLAALAARALAPGATVCLEHDRASEPGPAVAGLIEVERRSWGETAVTIYRAGGAGTRA